jgi:hypothetical protein
VLAEPRPLMTPVPYHHPQGAVIWVKLTEPVAKKINR